MKLILGIALTLLGLEAMAAPGYPGRPGYPRYYEYVSVQNQSFYPDQLTAQAVCRYNGKGAAVTYTVYRQAGDRIDGKRSFDGRPNFQGFSWGGGMALDVVTCNSAGGGYYPPPGGGGGIYPPPGGGGGYYPPPYGPNIISVSRQLYYPDELTAQGVCELNGYRRQVGFTSEKVAGNKIDGKRSFNGRPYFQAYTWGGGMDLESVSCQ